MKSRPNTLVRVLTLQYPLSWIITISGCPTVATRNAWELPLANFTVKHGDNHLSRPVAGVVEAGYIQNGKVHHTNVTLNTETGEWKEIGFERMYIRT